MAVIGTSVLSPVTLPCWFNLLLGEITQQECDTGGTAELLYFLVWLHVYSFPTYLHSKPAQITKMCFDLGQQKKEYQNKIIE